LGLEGKGHTNAVMALAIAGDMLVRYLNRPLIEP
jgi:hypothetical protein